MYVNTAAALLFLTKTSLSTTASLLQPPLQMTAAVLLPSLYYALTDLLSATTPIVRDGRAARLQLHHGRGI